MQKSCFNHVHFLMVPPSPTLHHTTQPPQSRSRAHEYFYRRVTMPNHISTAFSTLLPSLGPSEVFRLVLPDKRMTVAESADALVAAVKERCAEIHRRQPQTRIVLVGWATSCLINCRVDRAVRIETACAGLAGTELHRGHAQLRVPAVDGLRVSRGMQPCSSH